MCIDSTSEATVTLVLAYSARTVTPRQLVEDGMVPHDGGAPCWAGADDPPGSCVDRAADLDREDEV